MHFHRLSALSIEVASPLHWTACKSAHMLFIASSIPVPAPAPAPSVLWLHCIVCLVEYALCSINFNVSPIRSCVCMCVHIYSIYLSSVQDNNSMELTRIITTSRSCVGRSIAHIHIYSKALFSTVGAHSTN